MLNVPKFLFYIFTPNGCGFAAYMSGNGKASIFEIDANRVAEIAGQKILFDNLGMGDDFESIVDSVFPMEKQEAESILQKYIDGNDLGELISDFIDDYEERIKSEEKYSDGIDDWQEQNGM